MSFVPSFANLRRLRQQTVGVDLYTELQKLSAHSLSDRAREIPKFTQKICSEIGDFARTTNSPAVVDSLCEFLEGTGHDLSKIKLTKDKAQKQKELLDLLMSEQTAKFISDRIHWYLNDDASHTHESDEGKQSKIKSAVDEMRNNRESDLQYTANQASCDPIGRIIKRIFEICIFIRNLDRINKGLDPVLANSAADAITANKNSLARPPIADPDPMSMKNRIFG